MSRRRKLGGVTRDRWFESGFLQQRVGYEPHGQNRTRSRPEPKVRIQLCPAGLPDVFAIGDTALALAWDGQPAPGLAPAEKQGGAYVAAVLRARLHNRKPPPPFRYRHQGSLATIGRKSAVAEFGRLKLTGAPAWWLWDAVHVMFLLGVRNRLSVVLGWVWSYFTFDVGARLITDEGTRRLSPSHTGAH